MDEHSYTPALLVGAVLHDLAVEADAALVLASALEHQATQIGSNAGPQKLRETAALLKCAALQLGLAAANLVGSAERLRLVAEFVADAGGSELPS
jgi:hypothetical protein